MVNERERDYFRVTPIDEIDFGTIVVGKIEDNGAIEEILVNGEDEIADERFTVTKAEWRRIVDGPIEGLLGLNNNTAIWNCYPLALQQDDIQHVSNAY